MPIITHNTAHCQDILRDIDARGQDRRWSERKRSTLIVAAGYDMIGQPRKADSLRSCGTWLEFVAPDADHRMTLHNANFCRVRMCPLCAWRRSLKIYSQVRTVTDEIKRRGAYRYLFLTLTMRNCAPHETQTAIDDLLSAFKRLVKADHKSKSAPYGTGKNAVLLRSLRGYYRGLEITRDMDERISDERYRAGKARYDRRGISPGDLNPNYGSMHPHLHVILCVEDSYFLRANYLTQLDWTLLWAHYLGTDYNPVVDIRVLKDRTDQDIAAAVAESAKYSVKPADYINPDDMDKAAESLAIFDAALHGRRLAAFGGLMRTVHKELNLDDLVDGDLIHTDGDTISDVDDVTYITYAYNTGAGGYYVSR